MLRNLSELFLASILLIYAFPYLVYKISRADKYIPLPVIQIISGLMFGPALLGAVYPDIYNYIFTKDNINALSGVAWLGVIFFVWTAGVHLDLPSAIQNKKDMLTTSSLALLCPLILGSLFAFFIHQSDTWVGADAQSWQFILGIGMALAVTALPILILLMEKLNIFNIDLGKRVLRYASLDDIMIWAVLSIIIMDWNRSLRQLLFIPVFYAMSRLINYLMPKLTNSKDLWSISLCWVVLVSLAADWSGLHYIVGGFLAGAVMKKEWFDEQELNLFKETVLMLMMPVFFLITGLRTNWEIAGWSIAVLAISLFIVQFVGKMSGVFVASKILSWPRKEWMLVGTLLQTKALIEIIFCTILLDKGIITSQMFTALLIMAVLSTVSTIPLCNKIFKNNPALVAQRIEQ